MFFCFFVRCNKTRFVVIKPVGVIYNPVVELVTLFVLHLHLYSLGSCVCILPHLYALTSILTYTYVYLQICIHIIIHISALL